MAPYRICGECHPLICAWSPYSVQRSCQLAEARWGQPVCCTSCGCRKQSQISHLI